MEQANETGLDRFVPNVRFEKIPIKDLYANQQYQRNLSETAILKMVEDFDVFQINPVKVSVRDGVNYVFDGQHTIEAVALASGSRETPVWCMIYDDLTYTHEAGIFADQQKHVKPLSPYEIFKGHLEAGDSKCLTILQLVRSYDLDIGSSSTLPRTICAVSALTSIYDKHGYHVLDRTLRLCVGTWEGERNSYSANILNGIARCIVAYGNTLQDDIFKDKVGKESVKTLVQTAKERMHGSLGYAEAMVIFYNKRSKAKLPIRRLYGNVTDEELEADEESIEDYE